MVLETKELKRILMDFIIPGEKIKLIVSREGSYLTSIGLEEDVKETFAAMCATMYGAGETAFYTIEEHTPDHIEIISTKSNLFIIGAGESALIAVMVSDGQNTKKVLSALKKLSTEVEDLDTP